jgi:hypothetical protein
MRAGTASVMVSVLVMKGNPLRVGSRDPGGLPDTRSEATCQTSGVRQD